MQKEKNNNVKNIILILIKLIFVLTVIVGTFTFIFGILRYQNIGMDGEIKPGDLAIYFRLNKNYRRGDLVVASINDSNKKNKPAEIYRVIALSGDKVDIRDGDLYVNDIKQVENYVKTKTKRLEEGVEFPLVVSKNNVFILSDNREQVLDSRIVGDISVKKLKGKLIFVLKKY